jgi:hypothetical protein
MVSNAIRVGTVTERQMPSEGLERAMAPPLVVPPRTFTLEHDPASTAAVAIRGGGVQVNYSLAPGGSAGQYVALVSGEPNGSTAEQIAFRASSPRPMRLSLQIRNASGERWRASVYLDETPRDYRLPMARFKPVGRDDVPRGALAVQAALFVVDTTNTRPGTAGQFVVEDVKLLSAREPTVGPKGG